MGEMGEGEEGMSNTFRSRKLLDLAHGMPCMAKFPHLPCGGYNCEPAHSDSQLFGRGHSHKSADWAFAAMCQNAHMRLDDFERSVKQAEWLRAFIATQNYIWSEGLVIVNPKRKAA